MKRLLITAMSILITHAASAQNMTPEQMRMIQQYQNMDPQQMQQMMQGAQAAAACMGNLDMAKIQELQSTGDAINKRIKTLCSAGKKNEAEAYAMKEGMRMQNDPVLKKMQSCSKDIMKQFDFTSMVSASEGTSKSICD